MRTTGHHRKWSGNGERNGPSIDVYKSARTREASTRKTPFPRDFLSLSLSRSLAGVIERWIKKKTELSPSKDAYHANIPFPRTSNLRQECLTFPVVHDIVIACNSRQRREKESGEVITAADISDTHLDEIHNCWNNCSTREKARRFRSNEFLYRG